MKYYLVLSLHTETEYLQSNTRFDSLEEAITQWHVALSSYRNKANTVKVACSILDENHTSLKTEVYVKQTQESEVIETIG